jgi:hypothetical protein
VPGAISRSGGPDRTVTRRIPEGQRSRGKVVIPRVGEGRSHHRRDILVTWEERNTKTARYRIKDSEFVRISRENQVAE